MVTKTQSTIGITALILMGLLGSNFVLQNNDNLYFCEDRMITYNCDSLTAYYGLDNGKCWNDNSGNKLCRSGWIPVFDDRINEEDYDEYLPTTEHNSRQIICDDKGCKDL